MIETVGSARMTSAPVKTWTANGLAVSPTMASMCLDDFMRTIQFMRGTHDAIVDLAKTIVDRPVRVLYAGCGPHATLALPLMTLFKCDQVVFTLVDLHSESLQSAKESVERFELSSVSDYVLGDVGTLELDQSPDLIVTEVMQASLQKEPQVAVTRHLMRQAPDAVLIPQEVRVRFELVDTAKEFSVTQSEPERDRIPLGVVFALNRQVIDLAEADGVLPAATITMPDTWEDRYQPMLMTEIQVYRDHLLTDHQSGLTCPRVYPGDAAPGSALEFVYRLGGCPGLVAKGANGK